MCKRSKLVPGQLSDEIFWCYIFTDASNLFLKATVILFRGSPVPFAWLYTSVYCYCLNVLVFCTKSASKVNDFKDFIWSCLCMNDPSNGHLFHWECKSTARSSFGNKNFNKWKIWKARVNCIFPSQGAPHKYFRKALRVRKPSLGKIE